jgi:hypothetical protein
MIPNMEAVKTKQIGQESAKDFILGGNALFTLKNIKTETRFTYKVIRDFHNKDLYKVLLLTGPDNTSNYRQIAWIEVKNFMPELRPSSIHTRDGKGFVFLDHVWMNLILGLFMPSLEIWHNGRCCRCGRILTVPESIENGIGPECIKK